MRRRQSPIELMYPCCLANSVTQSTKWLPEHVFFVLYFAEILILEDYFHQKNLGDVVKQQLYPVKFALGMSCRSYNAIHIFNGC